MRNEEQSIGEARERKIKIAKEVRAKRKAIPHGEGRRLSNLTRDLTHTVKLDLMNADVFDREIDQNVEDLEIKFFPSQKKSNRQRNIF